VTTIITVIVLVKTVGLAAVPEMLGIALVRAARIANVLVVELVREFRMIALVLNGAVATVATAVTMMTVVVVSVIDAEVVRTNAPNEENNSVQKGTEAPLGLPLARVSLQLIAAMSLWKSKLPQSKKLLGEKLKRRLSSKKLASAGLPLEKLSLNKIQSATLFLKRLLRSWT